MCIKTEVLWASKQFQRVLVVGFAVWIQQADFWCQNGQAAKQSQGVQGGTAWNLMFTLLPLAPSWYFSWFSPFDCSKVGLKSWAYGLLPQCKHGDIARFLKVLRNSGNTISIYVGGMAGIFRAEKKGHAKLVNENFQLLFFFEHFGLHLFLTFRISMIYLIYHHKHNHL